MTLLEMKKKVLGLIEELNPDSEYLTDDVDISTKINDVINMIAYEVSRIKKIPKYVEMDVAKGDVIDFSALERECGYEIYQIANIQGVMFDTKAQNTIIRIHEDGKAEIDCFVYPERITETTNAKGYEFELSQDVLEIMPYGIAGDLLKSDVSTNYGQIYSNRYESMLQRLDTRYMDTSIYIDGGVNV